MYTVDSRVHVVATAPEGQVSSGVIVLAKKIANPNSLLFDQKEISYFNACSKSAIKSSTSSTPTLKRKRLSTTPDFSRSSFGIEA